MFHTQCYTLSTYLLMWTYKGFILVHLAAVSVLLNHWSFLSSNRKVVVWLRLLMTALSRNITAGHFSHFMLLICFYTQHYCSQCDASVIMHQFASVLSLLDMWSLIQFLFYSLIIMTLLLYDHLFEFFWLFFLLFNMFSKWSIKWEN